MYKYFLPFMISSAWISNKFQNSNVLSVEVFSLIKGVTEFNTVRFREQESHETSNDGESSKNSLFWKKKRGSRKKTQKFKKRLHVEGNTWCKNIINNPIYKTLLYANKNRNTSIIIAATILKIGKVLMFHNPQGLNSKSVKLPDLSWSKFFKTLTHHGVCLLSKYYLSEPWIGIIDLQNEGRQHASYSGWHRTHADGSSTMRKKVNILLTLHTLISINRPI